MPNPDRLRVWHSPEVHSPHTSQLLPEGGGTPLPLEWTHQGDGSEASSSRHQLDAPKHEGQEHTRLDQAAGQAPVCGKVLLQQQGRNAS